MSEKRPVYIQLLTPKLEDVISILTRAKGNRRSWAEYAKDCDINPSTMSRIINGKQKKALSAKTIEKLYQHRDEGLNIDPEEFFLHFGMMTQEKQRSVINEEIESEEKLKRVSEKMTHSIINALYERSVTFERLEVLKKACPKAEEIEGIFGKKRWVQLLQINDGSTVTTCGFAHIPIVFNDEYRSDAEFVRKVAQLAIRNYSFLFLQDAWKLDDNLPDRVTFVFAERILFEDFLGITAKLHLNHMMTALLVNEEEGKVIDERPIGDQTGKDFKSIFTAPVVQQTNRVYIDQISMFDTNI